MSSRIPKPRLLCFPVLHILISAALTLLSAPADGQVNIEGMRGNVEDPGVSGELGLSASARTGNVEVVELGIEARVVNATSAATLMLIGSGDAGWEDGDRYSNEALAHVRSVFRPGKRLRPEMFGQLNYDDSARLDLRVLGGAGLRMLLTPPGRSQFWWGSAYMVEYERLDLAPGDTNAERASTHRWSNYISAGFELSESARLSWTQYYQPALDHFADARALTDFRMDVDASERVSIVTTFRMRFDSRPPQTTNKTSTTLRLGLNLTL